MAYEYERINNIGCVTSPISTDQAVEELQEVYRKAKAYEKLVELYPQKDEIPSDEFFMMMGYIIKELTDDER